MDMVKVTNRGTKHFRDMFDSVPLELAAGQSAVIPENMARHIFGYGEDDKRRALSRLGWLKTEDRAEGVPFGWMEAMAKLGHFVFTPMVLTEAPDGNVEHVQNAGKKAAA